MKKKFVKKETKKETTELTKWVGFVSTWGDKGFVLRVSGSEKRFMFVDTREDVSTTNVVFGKRLRTWAGVENIIKGDALLDCDIQVNTDEVYCFNSLRELMAWAFDLEEK